MPEIHLQMSGRSSTAHLQIIGRHYPLAENIQKITLQYKII
jgi:hypothetical protein